MFKNQRGMTLIEIMIVLTIIGGLVAVLLPKIQGAQDKAKAKEAKIQIGQIINQLNMYYTDCGTYPSDSVGLQALVEAPGEGECDNWGPDSYLTKFPKDPWKNDFFYSSEGGKVIVKSLGKDKREGGTGYDADISSEDM